MFDLFAKLWLKSVKRMTQAQARQTTRQHKLHAGLRKAVVNDTAKAVKASIKAGKTVAKTVAKSAAVVDYRPVKRSPVGATQSRSKRRAKVDSSGSRSAHAAPRAARSEPAAVADLGAGGAWRRVYQSSVPIVGSTRSRRLGGWLFLPTQPDAAAPAGLPLLVMLHGCGQTAPAFAAGTRMNQLAARQGFAVLYPQQSINAHPQRCWPWYRRTLQEGGDELALIAAMIERTCERHRLDARRVYVAGLSAGAALAHNLALRRPDLIAAVALHSGPVHGVATSRMSAFGVMQHGTTDALQPIGRLQREQGSHAMPTLIIQGTQDHVVRPVNAGQLFLQACAVNGLDPASATAPRTRARRPDCDAYRITDVRRGNQPLVRLVEVMHLAHAWSGGDASLRYNAAPGPDASLLLWDFMRRHVRA